MDAILAVFAFIGVILFALLLGIVGALFGGILVFFAWNLVMPQVFGLPHIDYVQAFALSLLSSLLIKSSSGSSSK